MAQFMVWKNKQRNTERERERALTAKQSLEESWLLYSRKSILLLIFFSNTVSSSVFAQDSFFYISCYLHACMPLPREQALTLRRKQQHATACRLKQNKTKTNRQKQGDGRTRQQDKTRMILSALLRFDFFQP